MSDDGVNWKTVVPGDNLYGYYNAAYEGDTYIIYGKIAYQSGYAVLTSKDGENWTEAQKDLYDVRSTNPDMIYKCNDRLIGLNYYGESILRLYGLQWNREIRAEPCL